MSSFTVHERAYGHLARDCVAGCPPREIAGHVPTEHELRRVYQLAKQLAEALEVADLRGLQIQAVGIRERVFAQLAALPSSGRYELAREHEESDR